MSSSCVFVINASVARSGRMARSISMGVVLSYEGYDVFDVCKDPSSRGFIVSSFVSKSGQWNCVCKCRRLRWNVS